MINIFKMFKKEPVKVDRLDGLNVKQVLEVVNAKMRLMEQKVHISQLAPNYDDLYTNLRRVDKIRKQFVIESSIVDGIDIVELKAFYYDMHGLIFI